MRFLRLIIILLSITLIVPNVLSISSSIVSFTGFSSDDLNNGYKTANFTYTAPIGININTLNEWNIFIQANDFLATSYGNKISIHSIEWKLSNNTNTQYKPLNIDKQLIASSNTHSLNLELNFRIKANWLTPAGSYSFPFEIILEESRNFSNKQKRLKKWPN